MSVIRVDPGISAGRRDGERLARAGSATETYRSDNVDGLISLKQCFPTGTTVSLEAATEMDNSSLYRDTFYWTRLGSSVPEHQPLDTLRDPG